NHESLISEINFDVLKSDEEMKIEEELFSKNFPNYFIKNDEVVKRVKDKIQQQLEKDINFELLPEEEDFSNELFKKLNQAIDSIYRIGIIDKKFVTKQHKNTIQVNINGNVQPYALDEFFTIQSANALL